MANPWDSAPIVRKAGALVVPQNPYADDANRRAEAAEQRSNTALGMDATRLQLSQMQAAQSADTARRAAEEAEQKKADRAARGGVETTESERTAAFLATRVANGLRDLKRIGNIGAPTLKDATLGETLLGNYLTDEDRQRVINAQREILDPALTLGTGAAYSKEQIDSYRAQYFAQPGDKPATIDDKRRRLATLMEAARVKSGAAAGMIDTAIKETGGFAPPSNPLTSDQQKLYDAYLTSNPQATPDQIRTFAKNAGLGEVGNAEEIVKARQAGAGVAPASAAVQGEQGSYRDSVLSQGLSGVNEGVASTLGAPVDLVNSALGFGAQGINALANTNLSVSDNPMLGSEWWRDRLTGVGSIGEDTGTHPFARRVGQSVGAAAVPIPGLASTGRQIAAALAGGLGGGVGAATAQQIAPGNPLAEMGGEILGGGLAGGASLLNGRRLAQREIESAVPTVPQLQQQAGNLYRQAEQNGVVASGTQTQDLHDSVARILADEGTISPTGRVSEVHPKVREAYATMQDYAGSPMNPTQMQTVRRVLGDGRLSQEPNERRVANLLMDEFDNWTAPLAPELADARGVASRYLNAQTLEQARELAEARMGQFSQSGLENGIRTEYRKLDRQAIRGQQPGFSDPLIAQIEDVSRGTTGSNVARALGKLAPRGVVSAGISTGVPFSIGSALGGPAVGAALSAATLGAGEVGRRLATQMADRGATVAELLARNGGDLPQAAYLPPDLQRILAAQASAQGSQYLDNESPNGY